jgi:hypothetical protein
MGIQGAPGSTGPQGPIGPQGPKGDPGEGVSGPPPTSDTFDPATAVGVGTFSNNNQTITGGNDQYFTAHSVMSHDLTTGKYYFEFTVNDPTPVGAWDSGIGVGSASDLTNYIGITATSLGIFPDGEIYSNNSLVTTTTLTWTLGCVIGIAIANGNLWYRVDNSSWNGTSADPVAGTGGFVVPSGAQYFLAQVCKVAAGTSSITVNTIAPFVNIPPSGFSAWGSPPLVAAPTWEVLGKGALNNQSSFSFTIPPGYSSLQLRMVDVVFSASDNLAFAVSYDKGATLIKDATNSDTYSLADMMLYQSVAGTEYSTISTAHTADWYAQNYNAWDQVGYLAGQADNFDYYMDFSLGNVNCYFKAIAKWVSKTFYSGSGGGYGFEEGAITINAGATTPPAKNRVNYIKFGPYKNMIGTDTSHVITSGRWYLLGLKD